MSELDNQLQKCLDAEKDAMPDRVMTFADGVGENLIVLGYESGAVCKDYIYTCRSQDDKVVRGRTANAIVELSDVICQSLIIFAKLRNITNSMADMTVEQLIADGLERQQERM